MSYSKFISRKTMAVLAASSVALISAGTGAGVAFAVDGDGTDAVATADFATMPETVNLDVHKYAAPKIDNAKSNGRAESATTVADAKAVEGVPFELYRFNDVDLTSNEGWWVANLLQSKWDKTNPTASVTLTADEVKAYFKKNGVKEAELDGYATKYAKEYTVTAVAEGDAAVKTTATGLAAFPSQEKGLYVVKENLDLVQAEAAADEATGREAGKKYVKFGEDWVETSKVKPAVPFVVALPMTDPGDPDATGEDANARKGWLKTVSVYPKNDYSDNTKTVKDRETPGSGDGTVGDGEVVNNQMITYTLKSRIPQVKPFNAETGDGLQSFRIIDPIHEKLQYDTNTAEAKVTLVDGNGEEVVPAVTLTAGTDYNIVYADKTGTTATGNYPTSGYATLTFTADGLRKLEQNGGAFVKWEFNVGVKDVEGSAVIPNQGTTSVTYPNDESDNWDPNNPTDTPPGEETPKVETRYGKVDILKKNPDNQPLKGAEFQVFECDAAKVIDPSKPVVVDGENTFVSNDEGKIIIDGLLVNDFRDNSLKNADGTPWKDVSFYCLKETKAPEGYEGLPELVQFQLLSETKTDQDQYSVTIGSITNVPKNAGFNLPLTGGKGVVPLVGLGGLLVLGAGGYAAVAAKRNRKTS